MHMYTYIGDELFADIGSDPTQYVNDV